METIRISVRDLVEFILRSGDIDNRKGGMADKEAMQMGSRLHRKIQGQMDAAYRPEVPLKYAKEFCVEKDDSQVLRENGQGVKEGDDALETGKDTQESEGKTEEKSDRCYTLVVEGRADGIFTEGDRTVIDEIKGIYRPLHSLEEPVAVHLAQAKCYAYIYASQHELPSIGVQMTYCNLESEEVKRFSFTYELSELESWFAYLITEYRKWCEFELTWREKRQASIKSVRFPFPYREGQKDLAAAVYRTIEKKKKIFIQAPTGVGKTISTVFPAVKAVGEGLGDKIFYLTAKTITRTVAAEAFELLKKQGLSYKVVTLTAKEKICPLEETECDPVHCPYAQGHFDRVNDAVFEMLTTTDDFSREAILAQSEKWRICPFEFSLDVSVWVDAVICDYNYVFDPTAHLKRFFGDHVKGNYLFLIDEAHNLVERGREMYSAVLYKEDFLEAKREVKEKDRKLAAQLERVNRMMLSWKRECEGCTVMKNLDTFPMVLMSAEGLLEEYLEEAPSGEGRKKLLDLYFNVRNFLEIYDRLDESYVIYNMLDEDGRFLVKLFCVDTAANIQECLNRGNSTVFFSATLLPVTYYQSLLSQAKDDYAVYARTPFSPDQRLVLIGRDVSTRYKRRGPREYERIARYIRRTIAQCPGNYMVFFPSYRMMEDVGESFEKIHADEAEVLYQRSGMSEEEREVFLKAFEERSEREKREKSLVGFCVMGGIFGEGIDLKGESLIGAIIVGTGLPQVCQERELLKDYYDGKGMDGFAYAYRIPGMNKVLQSAGRVIRTVKDRGVILLLDERFYSDEYWGMFPREWEDIRVCGLWDVEEKIADFWRSRGFLP